MNRLLQAMDVFVMPSLYEGLSVVAVEAQAAGLPCVFSDSIPAECVKVSGLVQFLPLEDGTERWAQEVLNRSNTVRLDRSSEIRKNDFDIRENAGWLQDFYLSHWKRVIW